MADQEHLNILRQGVEVWNQWRKQHLGIKPNLGGANLTRADLSGVDFSYAYLSSAKLNSAKFSSADLSEAKLNYADFSHAVLSGASLSGANLCSANLTGANLAKALLSKADFSRANLTGADFSHAEIEWTIFGEVDLSVVKGLETVKCRGKSYVDIHTLYRSGGNIPAVFLRGIGTPDTMIEYVRSLVGKPIDYYTCFISYSSKDQDFAERLYADLQAKGVRCWFAPEDLKIGDKFWHSIDESIRLYDKLLVVLSEHSVQSDWVEREVMAALEKEKQSKTVLFPITLDDAVKDCTAPWAADIRRSRHIGGFRNWKNHDEYQKALERLLRDLKASS